MFIVPANNISLAKITKRLAKGETIVFPTETSYGLGCDATNRQAVNAIFDLKGREAGKPVLVVVSDVEMIKPYIVWDDRLSVIAEKYWPGPLTVVVKAKIPSSLAPGVVSEDGTVAFRVTSQPIAQALVKALGKPLVATSANVSGQPSIFLAEEIVSKFSWRGPDIFINANNLPVVSASTIITLKPQGFDVLRQGDVVVTL